MIIISIIKCFVITTIIITLFSISLSFASNSNAILSDNRISALMSSSSNSHSIGAINTSPQNAHTSRVSSESVDKGSCTSSTDCLSANSYCNQNSHRCVCSGDFVNIHLFLNGSRTKQSTPTCLPVAKLDDKCVSHEQCLVTHSLCLFDDRGSQHNRNSSSNYCRCKEGYHQEDREETVTAKDTNQQISNRPICGEFVTLGNSWIGTFAIVCIMLLVILIGCFIGILRFQRWKQRPMASTITSLAEATGHRPHLMSSSPPPMGSVEAEFQNDFIQVFPMHHLEPMPDKNTSHVIYNS